MKNYYIDANIFVYFLDQDEIYGKPTAQLFEKIAKNKITVYISSLVIDETIWVIIKNYIIRDQKLKKISKGLAKIKKNTDFKQQCLDQTYKCIDFINKLSTLPNFHILPLTYKDIQKGMNLTKYYNILPHDAYHAAIMKNNKIRNIITLDKDFVDVSGVTIRRP